MMANCFVFIIKWILILPDTINVAPNAYVISMKPFSSGIQHRKYINDPIAADKVPINVIV